MSAPVTWTVIGLTALFLVLAIVLAARSETLTVRKMAVIAMLVAVYVILSMIGTLNLWWIRISVDSLPIILGALLYGPLGGLLVGLLGSFLGQLLSYGLMATTILWITPAAVRGLLIGLYAKRNKYELSTPKLAAVLIVTALIVTAINTGVMYFDSVLYGYYTYAYVFGGLVVRIVSGVATAIVMVFVAPPVVKLLRNTLQQVREK